MLTIVQVCEFLDCGDGVHRFHAPARAMSCLADVRVIDCDFHHRHFPMLAETADVMVMAAFNTDLLPLFRRRRRAGLLTVVEANDYYADLQAWNPLSMRWLDRSLQDSFHNALRLADAVQASMPELARRWRLVTDVPVAAFPNHLEDVPPLPPTPVRPLTIGWGGSPGHFADWYDVTPVLQRWLHARPDVHLSVMTNEYAHDFISLPPSRYRFRPFGSLDQYFDFVSELDIGLAPLLTSDYNRCRSDVKFLEYASRGAAGIYRDLDPYDGVVIHGETGLLYRTPDELAACLDRLADDAALRQHIRTTAYNYVASMRRLYDHVGERIDFYRQLGNGSTREDAPLRAGRVDRVLRDGIADGRYVQLRPGEAETALRKATDSPASAETAAALERLLARYPDYLAAWQRLGQIYNDLGNTPHALRALYEARRLDPERARTLAEIGRAFWRGGQRDEARRYFTEAIRLNPWFQPVWQYMFRALALDSSNGHASSDGSDLTGAELDRLVEQSRQALPASYPVALMAAPLYPAEERVGYLQKCLDAFAPTLAVDEIPLAGPAFSEAIGALPPPQLHSSAGLALLARAREIFPQSIRISRLWAAALARAGRAEEARSAQHCANRIERTGRLFDAEFPTDDGRQHVWQFCEHIHTLEARTKRVQSSER